MGYYFRSTNSDLTFKKDLDEEAVTKLSGFLGVTDPEHSLYSLGKQRWEDMSPLEKIVELLYNNGWEVDTNDGTVFFDYSKDSSADEMWQLLAPYIEEGSCIDFIGEDDCIWEYSFDGKRMETLYSDEPFFVKEDDFSAIRANEILKQLISNFADKGLSEDDIAALLSLSNDERTTLHNIIERKGAKDA